MIHERPKGQVISLGPEILDVSDIFFPGITDQVYMSYMFADPDIRKDLVVNIVLAGGTSLIPGVSARLRDEIHGYLPEGVRAQNKTKVTTDDGWISAFAFGPGRATGQSRGHSAWVGGAALMDLPEIDRPNVLIAREDYEAEGPPVLDRKCTDFEMELAEILLLEFPPAALP